MANMGCTVRAFDLYVDSKEDEFLGHPNITFSYVGLSNVKGRIEICMKTKIYETIFLVLLVTSLCNNNHFKKSDKPLSYYEKPSS